VRSSVLQAAAAVLMEQGSEDFSIAEVAARAGVHETSIYRRWGTKGALAVDASLQFAEAAIAIPDTGALRTDLIALLDRVAGFLTSAQGQAFLALTASRRPEVVAARRSYFQQRFDLALVIFDRAVGRGELPADVEPSMVLEALIAPLYLRLLVTGEPLDEWPRDEMVDRLLAAWA
jgi:AcrR family transcriptional regulator